MDSSGFGHLRELLDDGGGRIVFFVLDGLGGLPREPDGPTELEAACTPHLDRLVNEGMCGLHLPVAAGITPGSGPGHLGIFGYDPYSFTIGRGVLAAAGIDFALQDGDVAARGNFCTVDDNGLVTDRRAGRIDTETNRRLCETLEAIEISGADIKVRTIKEHRFLLVLRGEGLSEKLADTDPQETGVEPLTCEPADTHADQTADLVNAFVSEARRVLEDEHPANMVLLRGFDSAPDWPRFPDVFGLRAAAAAGYPMYRGLARLLGMDVLLPTDTLDEALATVNQNLDAFDYFFIHHKKTDSTGEDGSFDRKVAEIEAADQAVPRLLDMKPDVIVVTGDHSTPAVMGSHSWHPVPALLWSTRCRPDAATTFGERACLQGGLGARFAATELMPLALAHAMRLKKYGA